MMIVVTAMRRYYTGLNFCDGIIVVVSIIIIIIIRRRMILSSWFIRAERSRV